MKYGKKKYKGGGKMWASTGLDAMTGGAFGAAKAGMAQAKGGPKIRTPFSKNVPDWEKTQSRLDDPFLDHSGKFVMPNPNARNTGGARFAQTRQEYDPKDMMKYGGKLRGYKMMANGGETDPPKKGEKPAANPDAKYYVAKGTHFDGSEYTKKICVEKK